MKNSISSLLGFIISLLGVILVVTLDEVVIVELDLNQIDIINGGSIYVHTENGKLINNYRSGVIFPSDKITYKTDLIANKDETIQVIPTIKVIQTGENIIEPIEIKSFDLINKNQLKKISEEFFVGREGRTEIIIEYQIFNNTTQKQIDLVRLSGEIEVLSLSDKLQSDQNLALFLGVIFSAIIGSGTLTALYFNQKTSHKEIKKLDKQNDLSEKQIDLLQKQNKDLKEQFEIQNRPWIIIEKLKPIFAGTTKDEIPWDAYLNNLAQNPQTEIPKNIVFQIKYKNIGAIPAKTIRYTYEGDEKIPLQKFKDSDFSQIIFPNQELTYDVTTKFHSDKAHYIELFIEFSFESQTGMKNTDSVGMVWEYQNREFSTVESLPKE